MTPQEALSILDQAAARAPLTRGDHEAILKALQVLNEAIKKDDHGSP